MDLTNSSGGTGSSSEPTGKVRAVWAAILNQWPHTVIDRADPAGIWSQAINGLSTEAIRHAVGLLKNDTGEWAPTAGQFRALARSYQPVSVARKRTRRDAKENAKRATATWFSYRITQHLGAVPLDNEPRGLHKGTHWAGSVLRTEPPVINYHGKFDYRAVADAAPLPDSRPVKTMAQAQDLHRPCWDALWAMFEEVWQLGHQGASPLATLVGNEDHGAADLRG